MQRIIKIAIGAVAHQRTGAAHFMDRTVILIIQDPASTLGGRKGIVFQNHLGLHSPVQINAAIHSTITLFLCLKDIIALGQIFQREAAVAIHRQRLFTGRTGIVIHSAIQAAGRIQGNLSREGIAVQFGHRLCLCRNRNALLGAADLQGHAAVLIIGHIAHIFLSVDADGGQAVACLRSHRNDTLHTGDHSFLAVHGAIARILCVNGPCTNDTVCIKTEVLIHIRKGCTVLLGIEIPIAIQVAIRAVKVIGGNVGRIHINKAVFHGLHIHLQPLHVLPGNEQLQGIAIAFRRIYLSALGGGTQVCHFIVGRDHIFIAIFTVTLFEGYVTGRHHVDLKDAVFLNTHHIGRCQIHLDTAVHIAGSLGIHIDGGCFRHIVNEIHTLFTVMAGHSNVYIVAAIFVVQIQPVIILIGCFV